MRHGTCIACMISYATNEANAPIRCSVPVCTGIVHSEHIVHTVCDVQMCYVYILKIRFTSLDLCKSRVYTHRLHVLNVENYLMQIVETCRGHKTQGLVLRFFTKTIVDSIFTMNERLHFCQPRTGRTTNILEIYRI